MINFTGAMGAVPVAEPSILALATLSLLGLWPTQGGEATPIDSRRRIICKTTTPAIRTVDSIDIYTTS